MSTSHDTTIQTKRCTKCGNEYPATAEYFYRDNRAKDGLKFRCKKCKGGEFRKWQQENWQYVTDYMTVYRQENKEHIAETTQEYRQKHREKIIVQRREYYEKHRERLAAKCLDYRRRNHDKVLLMYRTYHAANREKRRRYDQEHKQKKRCEIR